MDELERLKSDVADLQRRVRLLEAGKASEPDPVQPVESQFGLTAVNRIGALTLAIGIIFFFKYAVDNEWIGRGGRVLLGLVVGLCLIASAEWLKRREQRVFAQGIAGCGLATLYITCYAAFAWYQIFSEALAGGALLAVSACAVVLSLRYEHRAIAALGFTGGLLTPILLEGRHADALVSLPYLFLIDLTCVAICAKRHWPALAAVTGTEALFAAFFLTPADQPDAFALFALALAVVHLATAALTRRDRLLHDLLYATGHGSMVLGLLREVVLWTERTVSEPARSGAQSLFGSLFLAGYGIGALAIGITRRSALSKTMGLVLIGVVIAKLYLWDVWFLERLYRMSAFGVLGILLLAASWIYSRAKEER